MTKEEKNDMYRKNRQNQIKSRKTRIISLIVVPVAGVIITLLLSSIGKGRQNDIASAEVLDSTHISEFLEQNESGSAIYTGTIKAADPVRIKSENGEYIEMKRTVEQEQKIYDKESDKYETKTRTISNYHDNCSEIEIDDVTVPYKAFHNLPSYSDTHSEGAANNLTKTTIFYTPSPIDGTFLLKCENGEISSAQYYESSDAAGESKKEFGAGRIIIWILVIIIEIYLVFGIIKVSKAIKLIEEKIQ